MFSRELGSFVTVDRRPPTSFDQEEKGRLAKLKEEVGAIKSEKIKEYVSGLNDEQLKEIDGIVNMFGCSISALGFIDEPDSAINVIKSIFESTNPEEKNAAKKELRDLVE